MTKDSFPRDRKYGASFKKVSLDHHFNWPTREVANRGWWQNLMTHVSKYPEGDEQSWGIPFQMGKAGCPRVIIVTENRPDVAIKLNSKANFLCILHDWQQIPKTIKREDPTEGLVVGEYELLYSDDVKHIQPVRARFEVAMVESPGPPWLAMPFRMWEAMDPVDYPQGIDWGRAQTGTKGTQGIPFVYAMPNPHPEKRIVSLRVRGLRESPLLVAGLTLYQGTSHPLRHLPRRTYRVHIPDKIPKIEKVQTALGGIARIEKTKGPRGEKWLRSPYAGLSQVEEPVVQS